MAKANILGLVILIFAGILFIAKGGSDPKGLVGIIGWTFVAVGIGGSILFLVSKIKI